MKAISVPAKFELWILDHVFQPFCDFTHKWFRLSFIFWAIIAFLTFISAMLVYLYRGLVQERDPMIIAPIVIAIITFVIPNLRQINISWLKAYDDAIYGLENPNRHGLSDSRKGTLTVSIMASCLWAIISLKHGEWDFWFLTLWICLSGYPLYAFCSVTPYCRRI